MSLEAYAHKRFLVVDELDTFRFSAKQMLKSMGLKLVDTAASAQKVISSLQDVDYDVILCNFDLGKGRNGQELLEELRFKGLLKYTALFFIITAEVSKDKVMGTLENEPDGYLVKPVMPVELNKRLSRALEQSEALQPINEKIDQQDFEAAIALCAEKIQEKDRYITRCLKTKAFLHRKLDQSDEARRAYEHALQLGDYDWAKFGLAELLIDDQRFDRAETLLNSMIENDTMRVEAYDLLAALFRKQNRFDKSLEMLEEAISISPNSVLRQKLLADLSMQISQPEKAVDAYRKVIKLGEQSIYGTVNNYLDFADCVSKVIKDDQSSDQKKLAKEGFTILGKANKRFFGMDDEVKLKTHMAEAKIFAGQGDMDKAQDCLNNVLAQCNQEDRAITMDTSMMLAKTLYEFNRGEDAEAYLNQVADRHTGNANATGQVYDLFDAQISLQARQKAADLNKSGIQYHSEGKLDMAIASFAKAIKLTPRHISLNLNLLQLLVKRMKQAASSPQDVKMADECLHRIRHIPGHHKEQKRYQYLCSQMEVLRTAARIHS